MKKKPLVATRRFAHALLCVFLSMCISSLAHSQGQVQALQSGGKDLTATVNLNTPWDWLQLSSGEWLKGELLRMENFIIYFDSDKLKDLSIKWEDIQSIYTSKPMAVLLRNLNTAVGPLQTRDGKIFIESQNLFIEFDNVLGIAAGSHKRSDIWSGNVAASTNLRKGNVNQKDINISVNLLRRTIKTDLRASYLGSFSDVEGIETTNEHRANTSFDYRWDVAWFWRPILTEFYRDPFQNIESQWTLGAGVGYYLMENYDLTWVVSAGPAFQSTKYLNSIEDHNPVTSTAFFVTSEYTQEITNDIDFKTTYQLILTEQEAGKATHHLTLGLSVDLTDALDLTIDTYWDRTAEPLIDDQGVIPEKNDYRFAVGLSFEM